MLTNHPGALYQIGGHNEEKLRIPALDDAALEMLSPGLDRAIAFDRDGAGAYLVDFSRPGLKQPIVVMGRIDIKDMMLGWGAWSPDGKQVALLLDRWVRQEANHSNYMSETRQNA